jgi:hypothetical protein
VAEHGTVGTLTRIDSIWNFVKRKVLLRVWIKVVISPLETISKHNRPKKVMFMGLQITEIVRSCVFDETK